jgi:hypothetical protein
MSFFSPFNGPGPPSYQKSPFPSNSNVPHTFIPSYDVPLAAEIAASKRWSYPLHLTLEELFQGKHCHFHIRRHLQSGSVTSVFIDLVVPPGTQAGTKLSCRGAGHERVDGSFQDIVFIIEQIPHDQFLRLGHDLAMRVRIPWTPKLKLGGKIAFAGINREERLVRIGHPNSNALKGTSTVGGAGMPILCKGNIIGRGNIIVKWVLLVLLLRSSC